MNSIESSLAAVRLILKNLPKNWVTLTTHRLDIYAEDQVGEIIITKFSLLEKIIQGTFEFEYKLIGVDSEEGPFKVTGTFIYSLDDDEYFD